MGGVELTPLNVTSSGRMEKAPAQGDRRAVGNERGQIGKRQGLGCKHADHGSVEEP